jgi:hypothetical protein
MFNRATAGQLQTEIPQYLDRVFFWNAVDLARKLKEYEDY